MKEGLNPMYGVKHSDKTKKLIGKKAFERTKNKEYKQKILKGLIKFRVDGNICYRPQNKIERIKINCLICEKEIIKKINSNQKYCSKKCNLVNCTNIANKIVRNNNKIFHVNIKNNLLKYISENLDLFKSKKRNIIYKEFKVILKKYDLKDIRNVKFIFTNKYNCTFEILYKSIENELNNYLKCMPNLHNDKV
jgi:hypothetical protein